MIVSLLGLLLAQKDFTDVFGFRAIDESVTRRAFNETHARLTSHYKRTGGGLNDYDRHELQAMYSKATSVCEWGVGESTTIASYMGLPRYTGIDSSVDWLNIVQKQAPRHFRFVWSDVGPIASWGTPSDDATRMKWPFYAFGAIAAEDAFDFYFVDGRFRVACACIAFLHASHYHNSKAVVGIHDFKQRSRQYGAVLRFAHRVGGFDPSRADRGPSANLILLQRNPGVQDSEILQVFYEHSKDKTRR